jgi:hypothetical protein
MTFSKGISALVERFDRNHEAYPSGDYTMKRSFAASSSIPFLPRWVGTLTTGKATPRHTKT